MDHLFVYGTLLSRARDVLGGAMRARLQREGEIVGAAVAPGKLYDLGAYPGMVVAAPRERDVIHGEVVRLRAAEQTLTWVDLYEDIDARDPAAGLYRRVPHLALIADGRAVRCWAYVLKGVPGKAARIDGGCWITHQRSAPA